MKKDQTKNNKEQPLVDKQLAPSQAKLTRNQNKRSFFRRRRSSDDVWQKTLSATMTTLAAPTSTAPQQVNTDPQPDAAGTANAANQAANGVAAAAPKRPVRRGGKPQPGMRYFLCFR